jgi:hypothetical protein
MPSPTPWTQLWRDAVAEWWGGAWRWVLMAAGAVLAIDFLLNRGLNNSIATAGALAVLIVGVALTSSRPMAIALLATPALFVTQRVGLEGGGISASDVALAAGFGTAVLLGDRRFSSPMRMLLWANLLYQFATLLTVIVNPHTANTIEWFHAWLLVSGALVMGWALGKAGVGRLALGLMVVACLVIAAGTIGTAIFSYYMQGHFFTPVYPTWPWEIHKNAAGTLMSFGVLILYVNPPWASFTRGYRWGSIGILAAAIVMTQSRQALIGLIIAVLVVVARGRRTGHSAWPYLLVIPGIWLVVATVIDQVESQNEFNSVFQRLDWMRELYAAWKRAPVFGHGLRFWYYNPDVPYQPPQAELEVATSAGTVGLVAFAVMWVVILVVLWRIDPAYGTLALVATLSRLVQAQFDLFWVAAQVSVPFVIAGICLGAMARGAPPGGIREGDRHNLERDAAGVGDAERLPTAGRFPGRGGA